MIYEVSSSSSTFRTVRFTDGVNIIVADKGEKSSINNSRNGLGKTTLIEIIHFCLGAKFDKNSRLSVPELFDWDFSIDLDINGTRIIAKRYINDPGKIFIIVKDGKFVLELKTDSETKEKYITVENWKSYLGEELFSIPRDAKGVSSRTILGFFVRREDGYDKAFRIYNQEKTTTTVINNAYVLGLNWQKSNELFDVRAEYEKLDLLKRASEADGESRDVLKSRILAMEEDVGTIEQRVRNFNVLPEYKEVQDKANDLTSEIQRLTNRNMFLNRKIDAYKESVKQERVSDNDKLDVLYSEVGIVFTEGIKKNLLQAKDFHKKLVENRKKFLETEIQYIKTEIEKNSNTLKSLAAEKTNKMKLLESHGALEEFSIIQANLTKKKEQLERLRSKYEDLVSSKTKMAEKKSEINAIKYQLDKELNNNSRLDIDIKVFHENNKYIYGTDAGNLVVGLDKKGNYKYDFDVEKGSSKGKSNMALFCYDLMLIENTIKLDQWGIDFLVHDSVLFDPVDERQKALSIELATKKAKQFGFQYIMTINSDQIPVDSFSDSFDYKSLIRLRLSDNNISESLLGIKISNPAGEEAD